MSKIVTRFAPSPTGLLHIGNARTAIFNYLFARHNNGKFLLRIEDTNSEKSSKAATDAIFEGLEWLGLEFDGDPVYQSKNQKTHQKFAEKLLQSGHAYKCYVTTSELESKRLEAESKGEVFRFKSPYRNGDMPAKEGVNPTIRLKTPNSGEVIIKDLVQGDVKIDMSELDDLIILRSDGTPTYMLAVVVDDHNMGITHVIRGDDHLTNTAKQILIYQSLNLTVPQFAHIPLIHGSDGAKLSKRHGALGVAAYEQMGYLPEAMFNYLLKLGWSHQNDEIISKKQAVEWFTLEGVNKAAARIDLDKLANLNFHYLKQTPNEKLVSEVINRLNFSLSDEEQKILSNSMNFLKDRAKNLQELTESSHFLFKDPAFEEDAKKLFKENQESAASHIQELINQIEQLQDLSKEELFANMKAYAKNNNQKIGEVAKYLRVALTGKINAPSVFDIVIAMGKENSCNRLKNSLNYLHN